jgi:subtilisin family serine protease
LKRILTTLEQNAWPKETGLAIAREKGLTGKGIRVAILDTGVDADHDEFAETSVEFNYIPHFPEDSHLVPHVRGFDTQGHGSHVTAIIAGKKIGIAPNAQLSVGAICESDSLQSGLVRFDNGLKWVLELFKDGEPSVLNLSVGYFRPATYTDQQWENWFEFIRHTMVQLENANVLAIASWMPTFMMPAELHEVVAVGGVGFDFERIHPGQYARQADLMGLGSNISSAAGRNQAGVSLYTRDSGASQAAAYVTGIATLWREAHPALNAGEIRDLMVRNRFPINEEDDMLETGLARFVDINPS